MKNAKLITGIILASLLILTQVAAAFAAPKLEDAPPITGKVTAISLETDINTGITTVLVTVEDEMGASRTVRISDQTAYDLGLLDYDAEGNPIIVDPLPGYIEIDPHTMIPDEVEPQHPVGSALVTFFSDIPDLDYEAIMEAHTNGIGFGVIAQTLWLTRKLEGDVTIFEAILQAKQDGDFSSFAFEDGTYPTNWGQFRKAVIGEDKKGNLGVVISQKDNDNNGNNNDGNNGNSNKDKDEDKDKDKDKDKGKDKDKSNNGNGHKP